jgi:transposase
MKELTDFIQANPDSRELKRALAVQMVKQNFPYSKIKEVLQVSISFISKWKKIYNEQGVGGLILKYKGSKSYLDKEQRRSVISWLEQKNYWHLQELVTEIEDKYEVTFASKQSYYNLFDEAGISWKKTQMSNPKKDPELVQKKSGNYDLVGKS